MKKHDKKIEKGHTLYKLPLVIIMLVILIPFTTNACRFFDPVAESVTVEPSPESIQTPTPAPEPSPDPEPEPIAEEPEPTPEPEPEIEIFTAIYMNSDVIINGLPTPLVIYEINEQMYLNLFELAYSLSDTDKRFYPNWSERYEALYLTSGTPFAAEELEFTQAVSQTPVAEPVDFIVFLDEKEISVSTFNIDGDIFVDINETAEAFGLIIEQDLLVNTVNIYTNRLIADTIARKSEIDPSRPMVALTFDDGPGKFTDELLDTLEQYNVVATFYVIGRQIDRYSDTVQRAHEMGCEIANHTWSHVSLEKASVSTISTQLQDTSDAIESVTGVPPNHMRPPYGRINYNVENVTRELDLAIVFWSIDPSDYLPRSPERIYEHIMEAVEDRDIILLHDIYDRSVEAAKRLIPSLIIKGYQLVTVSELMYFSGMTLEPGESYRHAKD